ncbi:hypothetical protein HH1059_01880 [Halorhodospira halochloris]|uniref:Uncharacterized protein n=1 Tax=Halorhodospira halochloris TaxID=1052 RepID=A0A2Z6EZJ9_HALHR|nr:hypothetical protein HH1059_01880 [Halorhodospira halochloris]
MVTPLFGKQLQTGRIQLIHQRHLVDATRVLGAQDLHSGDLQLRYGIFKLHKRTVAVNAFNVTRYIKAKVA